MFGEIAPRQVGKFGWSRSAGPSAPFPGASGFDIDNQSNQSAGSIIVRWTAGAAPTDQQYWEQFIGGQGQQMTLRIVNSAYSASKSVLNFARTLNAVTSLNFGNATDNPTYNFLGTGLTTFNGPVTITGTNGSAQFDNTGEQLVFTRNGFNFVTATGANATLQLQASGASGTVVLSANTNAGLTLAATGALAAPLTPLTAATTRVATGLCANRTADATAANNTLTADASLTLTFNETGKYAIEIFLPFYQAVGGTNGFQFDLNSGTATIGGIVFGVQGFTTAAVATAGATAVATATAAATIATAAASPSWYVVKGWVSVTGAGTLAVRWAQNTTSVNVTTLKAGAYFQATKVG